jgi:hypothetical protein
MGGVGAVQYLRTCDGDLLGVAVVHIGRGEQPDAAVAVLEVVVMRVILSSALLVEALEEPVKDLLPAELALAVGVVALGLDGGAELDGGHEEGAGLADGLEVAVHLQGRAQ